MSAFTNRSHRPLSKNTAIIMAVISIFLGSVFISVKYSNASIERENAEIVSSVYNSYVISYSRRDIRSVELICKESKKYTIHGSCVSDELLNSLEQLPDGAAVEILIQPKSDYVVELNVNGKTLLEFEYAQLQLEFEGKGFFVLGIVMYVFAVIFIVYAIMEFRKQR